MSHCFAKDCPEQGTNILTLEEIGTSFWCALHKPDPGMTKGNSRARVKEKRAVLNPLRGIVEAKDERVEQSFD